MENKDRTIDVSAQELANVHNALISLHVTGEDIITAATAAVKLREMLQSGIEDKKED